jgi:hypothetical protein
MNAQDSQVWLASLEPGDWHQANAATVCGSELRPRNTTLQRVQLSCYHAPLHVIVFEGFQRCGIAWKRVSFL